MNDILPDEAELWLGFEEEVRDWLHSYGYRNIRMPLVEPTALFRRAIGEGTDIGEKEMDSFEDGPDIDAEQILMCARLWRRFGLRDVALQLNTLGDSASRHRHRAKLISYFEQHRDMLDADATRRLHSNPLRILDSKNPAMQELVAAAPRLADELEDDALRHFDEVQAMLKRHDVAFEINPHLVRGLDYYNRTVFEWVTTRLGAQGTICAGGRYDGLVSQIVGGQI